MIKFFSFAMTQVITCLSNTSFLKFILIQVVFSLGPCECRKLVASDGAIDDQFGNSVSLSSDYAIIGAYHDDIGANSSQGSAYVFFRNIALWDQQAKLVASDGEADDQFGISVSLSGDHALVGANNADSANGTTGSAYIFLRNGTAWNQEAKLTAADGAIDDEFGYSVSLSGGYALIGAYHDDIDANADQGSAYVFVGSGSSWDQQAKLNASDGSAYDSFGFCVSLSGDYALIGAFADSLAAQPNQGSAYVYHRSSTLWTQQAQLTASDGSEFDYFGFSVSLSGDYALIGAPSEGSSHQGSAYLFHRNMTSWDEIMKLTAFDGAADDYFGNSVSLSGSNIVIGVSFADIGFNGGQGAMYYFFNNESSSNIDQSKITEVNGTSFDFYGYAVSAYGNFALSGAYWADVSGNSNQGSAYLTNISSLVFHECPNGTYAIGSLCRSCSVGTYNPYADQSSCLDCPIGKYTAVNGSFDCLSCQTGKYNDQIGQGSCISCSSGTYNPNTQSTSVSSCIDCAAGKSVSQAGQAACVDCVAGKFSSSTGQVYCDKCSLGKYADQSGLAACIDCVAGKRGVSVQAVSELECSPCEIGKYSSSPGQEFCPDCEAGKYSSSPGNSACSECPVDYFQPSTGEASCPHCGFQTCTKGDTGRSSCDFCSDIYNLTSVTGCVDDIATGSTSDCPTIGGVIITMTGEGWNLSSILDVISLVGGKDCPILSIISSASFTCLLPPNVGLDIEVVATDSNGYSGRASKVSYASAIINSVHGCGDSEALPDVDGTSACSRDGSDEVSVSGSNFGQNQAIVLIGGAKGDLVALADRGLSGWEQNTTIVQVPAGSGLGVGVNVLQKGGELSDGVRMLSYKSCDPGYYNLRNELTGIYDCVECAPGFYNLANESFSCEICSSGSYCSSSSISSCDSILSGSSSPLGSTNASSCICPLTFLDDGGVCSCDVGFGYDGDSCVACSQDSIKPDVSLSTCSSCKSDDPNSVSNDDSTVCICGVGFVMADQDCVKCDGGMICDEEGSILTSISLESGHWRESSTDLSTRECPYEDACTGSSDISNQCLDGHSGPLCAVCEDRYTSSNSNSACERCFEKNHIAGLSIVIVLLALIILIGGLSKFGNFGIFAKLSLMNEYLNVASVRVQIKVMLAYLQIIGSFTSVLSSSLPANYTTFLTVSQTSSLNFGSIFAPRCFNPKFRFYDTLVVQTMGPIIIGLVTIIVYLFLLMIEQEAAARTKLKNDCVSWIFFFCFLFFPAASTTVFQTFNCDDDFESGSSYLKADYRLECDGPEYDGYVFYALFMMFVYPIGIPAFFYCLLFFRRSKILKDANLIKAEDARSAAVENCFDDMKKIRDISFEFDENKKMLASWILDVTRRCKIERARRSPELVVYSPLFEAYKPEYWYWECIECLARLSLTGLLVFLYPGTEKQVLLAMLICMMLIILYFTCQPFLMATHNQLLIAAQWGILLQLYGVYLIISKVFDTSESMIGWFMISVGAFFPVFTLARGLEVTKIRKSMTDQRSFMVKMKGAVEQENKGSKRMGKMERPAKIVERAKQSEIAWTTSKGVGTTRGDEAVDKESVGELIDSIKTVATRTENMEIEVKEQVTTSKNKRSRSQNRQVEF